MEDVYADYLVYSAPSVGPLGIPVSERYGELEFSPDARPGRLWGYETYTTADGSTILGIRRGPEAGFERVMCSVAGGDADAEFQWLKGFWRDMEPEERRQVSVRRIDLQITVAVPQPAYSLIETLEVAEGYARLRVSGQNRHGESAGLYVGSPTSDIRLRVYDKTAQLKAQGRAMRQEANLLRVELILRRSAAWRYIDMAVFSPNDARRFWFAHTLHRVPGLSTIVAAGEPVPPLPRRADGKRERATERWLYDTVAKAVARNYRDDVEGLEEFIDYVRKLWLRA